MNPTEDYCVAHTTPLDDQLNAVYRSVQLHTANPHMASSPYQGIFLQMLASSLRPDIALEIGTHVGFGTSCIARGLDQNATLHTIEANEEYEPLIREHTKTAGIQANIQIHIGNAEKIIPSLPDGIGLAYIDADKENYPLYYNLILPKMKEGGIILLDNMLWYGRVVDLECNPDTAENQLRCNREARIIHKLNQDITADERVDNILLPFRDGIMMCRVR